jgi:hypothetical protein
VEVLEDKEPMMMTTMVEFVVIMNEVVLNLMDAYFHPYH